METITYSQVQKIIKKLPAAKLPFAYHLLVELADNQVEVPSLQLDFMHLPLNERRRIMAQQAKKMISHYEKSEEERQGWQGGDFFDAY